MNAEQLLAQYERVADAPDAIERLRSLVLELAIRGRLTETEGRWIETTLGDIGEWGSGGTPLKTHPEYYNGDIPWLVIGDLNDGVVTAAETLITQEGLNNSSAKLIEPGTVLIAMYGSIGKLGIAGIRCATNQAIAFCIPRKEVVSIEFLFLLLRSLREHLLARGQGVAQQNISQKILKAYPITLPPSLEQHRIVAKVDELMALCDQLEAARAQREAKRDRLTAASLARLNTPDPPASPDGDASNQSTFQDDARFALNVLPALTTRLDQVKQLRQTVLDLAVRGRLAAQISEEGSGNQTLLSIRSARSTRVPEGRSKVKADELAPVGAEDIYLDIPPSWAWARIKELGKTQTGTSPSSTNEELFGDFIPFIKPSDLNGSEINYSGPGLSEIGVSHSRLVPPGSVLMVCIGATLGKVNTTTRPACFNQQINSVSPFLDGMTKYLALALKASGFQSLAWVRAGTGTLPIISKGKWEVLPVPIPPLAEQHRIVAKVDELMALCDQLEASLSRRETTRSRLLNALLHEALAPADVTAEAA